MCELFLDAYKTWPPQNQMIFAIIVVLLVSVLLHVHGSRLLALPSELGHCLTICIQGWPDAAPPRRIKRLKPSPLLQLPYYKDLPVQGSLLVERNICPGSSIKISASRRRR